MTARSTWPARSPSSSGRHRASPWRTSARWRWLGSRMWSRLASARVAQRRSSSTPMARRPSKAASTTLVPVPARGSTTSWPGAEYSVMMRRASSGSILPGVLGAGRQVTPGPLALGGGLGHGPDGQGHGGTGSGGPNHGRLASVGASCPRTGGRAIFFDKPGAREVGERA